MYKKRNSIITMYATKHRHINFNIEALMVWTINSICNDESFYNFLYYVTVFLLLLPTSRVSGSLYLCLWAIAFGIFNEVSFVHMYSSYSITLTTLGVFFHPTLTHVGTMKSEVLTVSLTLFLLRLFHISNIYYRVLITNKKNIIVIALEQIFLDSFETGFHSLSFGIVFHTSVLHLSVISSI